MGRSLHGHAVPGGRLPGVEQTALGRGTIPAPALPGRGHTVLRLSSAGGESPGQ